MQAIRKAVDATSKVLRWLMIFLMALMVVSMFTQVVTRWIGVSVAWTEEMTRFACIWLIFLGSAILADRSEHIAVTILDSLLKGKALAVLNVLRKLCFLVFSVVIVKVGFDAAAMVARQTSPNMGIAMNIMYISIPIGSILTALYIVASVIAPPHEEAQGEEVEQA